MGSRVHQWKKHRKSAAAPYPAGEFNIALHHGHQAFHNRQSQANAAMSASSRAIYLAKGVKNIGLSANGDSGTRIRYLHSPVRLIRLIKSHTHGTGLSELDGITGQVNKDLTQALRIADQG